MYAERSLLNELNNSQDCFSLQNSSYIFLLQSKWHSGLACADHFLNILLGKISTSSHFFQHLWKRVILLLSYISYMVDIKVFFSKISFIYAAAVCAFLGKYPVLKNIK